MSLNHSVVTAFQGYVRTYSEDIYGKLFYGFPSAALVRTFEGIKGQHILTEAEIGTSLARKWAKTFDATTDAATFRPRTLSTVLNKADISVYPQDYEASYMGMLRQKGQNPADWPFSAYLLDQFIQSIQSQMEVALWSGAVPGSPAADDALQLTFDGVLEIIKDEITATTITPVATGALTLANIIQKLRDMWATVAPAYKLAGVDIYMSYANYDLLRTAIKDTYKIDVAYVDINGSNYQGIRFELGGGNTRVIPVIGMGSSNRVIMMPSNNIALGIDSPSDVMFNAESEVRELRFWMDFRMGAQLMMVKPGVVVVNDQV